MMIDNNFKFWGIVFFGGSLVFLITNPSWLSIIVFGASVLVMVLIVQSIRIHRKEVSDLVAGGLSPAAAKRQISDAKVEADAQEKKRDKETLTRAGEEMVNVVLINGITNVRVKVFKNGYVKVGTNPIEELISISSSMENLGKKSAAGRAVGFYLTGGLNMLSPNKRGDITLTIATVNNLHVIHTDYPTETQLKGVLALETAGKAVVSRSTPRADATSPQVSSDVRDVGQSLEALAALHSKGQLTDDEFSAAKKQLLKE